MPLVRFTPVFLPTAILLLPVVLFAMHQNQWPYVFAAGAVKEPVNASRRVVVARVRRKRTRTTGRVVVAAAIAAERLETRGCVLNPQWCCYYARFTGGRVVEADGVAIERSRTVGRLGVPMVLLNSA
jgi:hypothetical protein